MAPVDLTLNNVNFPLNDVLKAMDLREVSDPERAVLSYASKQSQVDDSNKCQQNIIVPTAEGNIYSRNQVIQFETNHPYLYIIFSKSGIPLFVGHLSQPIAPKSTNLQRSEVVIKKII
ncbi:unnamed protein product [Hymenolepis diminuta]|uniref:Serpin domain-containing protein n=1 Tax=Hymenolepis diminuta TaxID=6216 RepID=A0A564YFL1_HYMDI|nr:unnamed protein product [Hymenolepis diminuta]